MDGSFRARYAAFAVNLLRVGTAVLFMQHGVQKTFGWLGGLGQPGVTAPLVSQLGLAGVLEVVGGLLLLLGLLTRPVALVLAVEMLVGYFQAHFPRGGWPVQNQGELALLYLLIFVFFSAHGAGTVSLDALLRGRRGGAAAEPEPRGAV